MPETARNLIRRQRTARPKTDGERLRHRDRMRALRARPRQESIESICAAVGLNLSPQSSLNPVYWNAVVPGEGLYLAHIGHTPGVDDHVLGCSYFFGRARLKNLEE
jgi:hypothetical protein